MEVLQIKIPDPELFPETSLEKRSCMHGIFSAFTTSARNIAFGKPETTSSELYSFYETNELGALRVDFKILSKPAHKFLPLHGRCLAILPSFPEWENWTCLISSLYHQHGIWRDCYVWNVANQVLSHTKTKTLLLQTTFSSTNPVSAFIPKIKLPNNHQYLQP